MAVFVESICFAIIPICGVICHGKFRPENTHPAN
nr:MAG TPA: Choline/ethanolamine kinase [Caudoviricetes sp.]